MRRDELTEDLRQPYTLARGFGTARVGREGYENVWFVIPPPPPREIPAGLPASLIAGANAVLQGRPSRSEASELDRLAAYLIARREAVSSSRLEGTWSTIDSVLTPGEVHGEPAESKSQHQAVRGYAVALEQGLARIETDGVAALTRDLVCRLHKLVMSRDPGFRGVPGRVRTGELAGDVVQIGGGGRKEESIYNPAPPEHAARCLEVVMDWMRDRTLIEMGDAGMGMSLPVRMAIGHAHFEAVHPFSDGNGRIGRILWPLQMAAAGHLPLYLSGYVEEHRDDYSRALQDAQKRLSYGRIVEFLARAIVAAQEEERMSKDTIGGLPALWRERGTFRRGSSALRALDVIVRLPIVTAKVLSQQLGVSFQAASLALNALADKHVVRERTGYGRNRVFAAEEVIAVLARRFGEDPKIALEGARATLGL